MITNYINLSFFLKPEVTATYDGVKTSQIVADVLKRLADAKITVGGIRILSGQFLESSNMMAEHYGVISNISRHGHSVITESSKAKLEEIFGKELKAGTKVLGAHELLKELKGELNPFGLRVLNDNFGYNSFGWGYLCL